MGDSESFSSLIDLVNSHLSKTSLNTSQSGDEGGSLFPVGSVRIQTDMSQSVSTPPNGIMLTPSLGQQGNEISGILAQQLTNMLVAKEKTRQAEEHKHKQKVEEQNKQLNHQKLNGEDYNIDLIPSIVTPNLEQILTQPLSVASTKRSFDSMLADARGLGKHETMKVLETLDTLPLKQDMSYMLVRKVKKGKPSPFGKVICSRVRPVAAPYLMVDVNNAAVQRFDFSTQSPCDINLQKRHHPPQDRYANMNMVERFMAQSNKESLV